MNFLDKIASGMGGAVSVFVLSLLLSLFIISCKHEYTPKPRGFFRIDMPEKKYKLYYAVCPFTFEHPTYSMVYRDAENMEQSCWINIFFPAFNATIHMSFHEVENNFRKLAEDSRALAMKHTVKADAINESPFVTRNKSYGVKYEIEGNVASAIQFYITDSTKYFLRGSLYFNVPVNADSLSPVIAFINDDIDHLISTFNWKY